MRLLNNIKPIACTKKMLIQESDLHSDCSYSEILTFHSYNKSDEENIFEISQLVENYLPEAISLLKNYCDQIIDHQNGFTEEEIGEYVSGFFHLERNEEYFRKLLDFIQTTIVRNYPVSKLIPGLNQLQFFFTTVLLSKKGMIPNKCLDLMTSLQKAYNLEQQLLIDQSNIHLYEVTAINITELIHQNTEIMYMKDFLDRLKEEDDQIQSIKAASEELAVSVDEVAQHTVSVAESTDDAVEMSEKGQEVVERAIKEIMITNTEFEQIVHKVNELQSSVKQIEDVVNVINGISNQTNLLALNAAIEAARAGEAGRGFAVVAEEVRKLSDNNVNSLKTVKENVTTLQAVSTDIYNLTSQTKTVIDNNVMEAKEVIPMISNIIVKMKGINEQTNGTAATAEEQAAGVTEVADRMTQIAEISRSLNELSHNTIFSVHKLSKMLSSYRDCIFSCTPQLSTRTLLELAKSDHILWKWKIYNMLLGVEKVDPSDVNNHEDCRLGKWYFLSSTKEALADNPNYQELNEYHKMVHDCAKQAAIAYKENDVKEADLFFNKLEKASLQVIVLIDKIIEEVCLKK